MIRIGTAGWAIPARVRDRFPDGNLFIGGGPGRPGPRASLADLPAVTEDSCI